MNGPDNGKWKEEIENEHKQMVTNKVWEPLDKKNLPEGAKVITWIWACKKKSNSTYHGQLTDRGFKQVAGKYFDPMSTAAPVTNNTTIRIVLVIILLADWTARIYDIKVKGKFEDGEVPQGMEHHYWDSAVLMLLKPIYGLKQAALLHWQRVLEIMKNLGTSKE